MSGMGTTVKIQSEHRDVVGESRKDTNTQTLHM